MKKLFDLIKWIWRAWPLLVMISIWSIHYSLLHFCLLDVSSINKCISFTCQMIGGGLILYFLNANIRTLKNESLDSLFSKYIEAFPLKKQSPQELQQKKKFANENTFFNHTIKAHKNPQTEKEKFEYLQEQINDLEKKCDMQFRSSRKNSDDQFNEAGKRINTIDINFQDLKDKFEEVFIGNIRKQLFGFFVMIYGAIVSSFPQILFLT